MFDNRVLRQSSQRVAAVEVGTEAKNVLTAMLENVPMFISNIASDDEEQRLQLQEEVNARLDEQIEIGTETISSRAELSDRQHETLSLQMADYTVVELTNEQKLSAQNNPLFANAFLKLQEAIDIGEHLHESLWRVWLI